MQELPQSETQQPPALRALQEAATAAETPDIATVTTPEQLQEALVAQVRHVEIKEHLDLTTMALSADGMSGPLLSLHESGPTWSIRVRSTCFIACLTTFTNLVVDSWNRESSMQ
jgi:hypothetical protein